MKKGITGFLFVGMVISLMSSMSIITTEIQAASEWKPSQPIQFIVPYGPGGGSDVLARTIAKIVESEKLSPQPLIITNMPGGGAMIGTNNVAQAVGNTHMLLTFISAQVIAPIATKTTTGTYKDLTMISGLALDEQIIVVKNDSRFKSLKDIIEELKKNPNSLTIGGGGMGSDDHICNGLLERTTGQKFRYVSFGGSGDAVVALLGGHVDMIWANPGEFIAQYAAKMVRPIAVAKEERMKDKDFEEVPTLREFGYDITYKFFRGIAAPSGIPKETVSFYESMIKKVTDSKEWKDYLKKYMLTSWYLDSKKFTQTVTTSATVFRETLEKVGFLK